MDLPRRDFAGLSLKGIWKASTILEPRLCEYDGCRFIRRAITLLR